MAHYGSSSRRQPLNTHHQHSHPESDRTPSDTTNHATSSSSRLDHSTLTHRSSSPKVRRPHPEREGPHPTHFSSSSSLALSFKRARTSSPDAFSDVASSVAATPRPYDSSSDIGEAESQTNTMSDAGPIGNLRLDDDHTKPPSSQSPPSLKEQAQIIQPLVKQPLQPGQVWYPVPRSWYQLWGAASLDNQEQHIPPLDCSELADSSDASKLKPGLEENRQYILVPEEAFHHLTSWYGQQGPTFKRNVISVAGAPPILQLYVPQLAFTRITTTALDSTAPPPVSVSKAASLAEVKTVAMQSLGLHDTPESSVRLWSVPPALQPQAYTLASDVTAGAASGEYQAVTEDKEKDPLGPLIDRPPTEIFPLAVEVKEDNGTWPTDSSADGTAASAGSGYKGIFAQPEGDYWSNLQQKSAQVASSFNQTDDSSRAPARVTRSQAAEKSSSGKTRGLKGLGNLGNTCFMNSALQCLSNTPELKDYFVSRVFEQEINEDNPLGNHGALANAFGSLIQSLWSGQGTSLTPRDFKWALARFAPQFSGYAQQDTQELLAFLLDGLHEDLNRIKKKPYIEAPDWEGGGLYEMVKFAKKQWEIYKMRNDSVIVDLFQGQYRSTLVCPDCSKVSIKFDPFMYLTLPLPNMSLWRHQVIYVPFDPQQPMQRINLALPSETSFAKLKQTLAEMFDVPDTKRLLVAEYWQHKIYRFYADYEPVHVIEKADHCIVWELPFELPVLTAKNNPNSNRYHTTSPVGRPPAAEERLGAAPPPGWQDDERLLLPVYTHSLTGSRDGVGIPFFVLLEKSDFNDIAKIQTAVTEQYARFVERHDELSAAIKALHQSQGDAEADAGDWQVIDSSSASASEQDSQPEPEVITELRADGQVIECSDYRPDSQSQGQRHRAPPIVQMLSDSGEEVDRSTSADAPFELHYMVNTSAGRPIFKEAESWPNLSEELGVRSRRLSSIEVSDEEERVPLVYRGGALVCVWKRETAGELLPTCEDDGQWGTNIVEVDEPRVAAEKKREAASGKRKGKQQLSIEDCLDEFTKEEKLGEDDPWYCPQCKDFRQATKKFDLWKVPDILVVHLKRFSAGRGLRDKIDAVVDFPLEGFDLSDRVEGAKAVQQLKAEGKWEDVSSSLVLDTGAATPASASAHSDANPNAQDLSASILSAISEANDDAVASDKPIYDLFAVDNHYGGLGGGHYTTSAKNADDNEWYYFDDSHVRRLGSGDEVKGSAAYLLFYRRRTTRPIGGKSREIVKTHVANSSQTEADAGDETMKGVGPSGGSVTIDENYDSDDSTSMFRRASRGRLNPRALPFNNDSDQDSGNESPSLRRQSASAGANAYRDFQPESGWDPSPAGSPDSSSPPTMPGGFDGSVQYPRAVFQPPDESDAPASNPGSTSMSSPMRVETPPPPYVPRSFIAPDATVETIPLDEADTERHTKEHQQYYRSLASGWGETDFNPFKSADGRGMSGFESPRSDVAAGSEDED